MHYFRNALTVLWGILAATSAYLAAYYISGGEPDAALAGMVYFTLAIAGMNLAAIMFDQKQLLGILVLGFDSIVFVFSLMTNESLLSGLYTNVTLSLTMFYLYKQYIAKES